MWHWIKRWRDWAMHELWPMARLGARPRGLHTSYEKAGLTIADQVIPWNAEAVLVEATLQQQPGRRKGDFTLRLPGHPAILADNLTRGDNDDLHHVFFRVPRLAHSTSAEIFWRTRPLGQLTLPVVGQEEYLDSLRLHMPTLFVRLGDQHVACQTFVASQCRGLMASAVLMSPHSLVPLVDLGLHVEFRSETTGAITDVAVQLSSSQLAGRQALVTAVPHHVPRRLGDWTATWKLGGRVLTVQRIRAISLPQFQRSLRLCDTRFVVQTRDGVTLRRQVPPLDGVERVGPCFLLASKEAGMAGLCTLQVSAQGTGRRDPPLLVDQEVLISDGPTMFAPGTLAASEVQQVSAFDVRLKKRLLGTASLCPSPTAAFTAEGGFKPADEYLWSTAAEDELTDRLGKLIEGPTRQA